MVCCVGWMWARAADTCDESGRRPAASFVPLGHSPSTPPPPPTPPLLRPLHTPSLQERKAAVIRAEGESESAKLISDATRTAGTGLIELRRIEAARDIASTLSKSRNVVYLPAGNSNMLLGINPTQG